MSNRIYSVTEHGENGPYRIGLEVAVTPDGVHHLVLRPRIREVFSGYEIIPNGSTSATGRIELEGSHEWRFEQYGLICAYPTPAHPPFIGTLPDEEHGHAWGDPIVSEEPYEWLALKQEMDRLQDLPRGLSPRDALSAMEGIPCARSELLSRQLFIATMRRAITM